jgi:uncharacterized protein (DUF362 family)
MPETRDLPSAVTVAAAKVGIIRCDDYEEAPLLAGLADGFRLFGGAEKYIRSGDTVFVKPNLIRAPRNPDDPPITNPALLYSLCRIIKDLGARPVMGDSPAFGTVRKILRRCGCEEKFGKLGVKLVHLRRSVGVTRTISGEKKRFVIAKDVCDSDFVINVPKLKVHSQLGMTLAIKNLFGCVPGKKKAWRHMSYGDKGDAFSRMIVETFLAVSPGFTVLDAIVAMERRGPAGGDPAKVGLLFFGEDCLAIERVVAEVLNIDPNTLPVYRGAVELGIGEHRLENISVLGDSLRELGHVRLIPPEKSPIRFSISRVVKSVLRNIWISRFRKGK